MNLPQAKTYLEKIITLYKNMSADSQNVSAIERDLMLSYVRKLYETFLDDIAAPAQPVKAAPVYAREAKQQPVAPPPPVVREEPKQQPLPPLAEAPPAYQPPVEPAPVFTPIPATRQPVSQPPVEAPRQKAPEPVQPPPPPPTRPVWNGSASAEIEFLFEDQQSIGDWSDKLALSPIADLTKAFGLNDKLLYINELFAGNSGVFDQTVKNVNDSSSFGTAANYLKDFATRYNWAASEPRKKQALAFLKLVRRRFR